MIQTPQTLSARQSTVGMYASDQATRSGLPRQPQSHLPQTKQLPQQLCQLLTGLTEKKVSKMKDDHSLGHTKQPGLLVQGTRVAGSEA